MHITILGAGAGGGLPQWNCGCPNCVSARAGDLPSLTQSSVAVSADGQGWVVLNASPDIRAQLASSPSMHPRDLRGSPIRAVVLTNGDIDHIAGLLTLREKTAFEVLATQEILDILDQNSVFRVLDPAHVTQRPIQLEEGFDAAGLRITPFAVPGKIALFNEGETVDTQAMGEQTIGLMISDGTSRLAYLPGCAALPDWLVSKLDTADMLLFDGTVWENDEMPKSGTGQKTGARMGHISMAGAEGSLSLLSGLTKPRKLYIHINNTNPALRPDGPERQALRNAGWELTQDGMELTL